MRRFHSSAAVVLALGTVGMAACSSGETAPPEVDPNAPTDAPVAGPVLVHEPNPGIASRTVNGEGFSISVPATFEERTKPGAGSSTNYVWSLPESGETPPYVGVIADPEPEANAMEQTKTLELSIEADGESEVTRSQLKWPGDDNAIFVQWDEETQTTTVTNWQLVTTSKNGTILNVVARAPAADFDRLGLAKVVATFTPSS